MTAIIPAGGKSSRMGGRNKAFLNINGRPLIETIIERLNSFFNEILIVANDPKPFNHLTNYHLTRIVTDVIPDKGPLGGIYTGLLNSKDMHNFVVACDMPFIKGPLISYFAEIVNDYDIVIPMVSKIVHPLFGIYSKDCIPVIEEQLKKDKLKISDIFPRLKTRFVMKEEIEKFDKGLISLTNINTQEEYAKL